MDTHQLHQDAIVIDGLNVSKWSREVLEGIHVGGVTAFNGTVAVIDDFRETMNNLAEWERLFAENADLIARVEQADDILAAKRNGKTGVILGFQNTSPIEDDLNLVAIFYRLGIRIIQITYNDANFVGSGCLERVDGGLTAFGIEMVQELNRLGILIDLSHVGYQTSRDAVNHSATPVAVTHGNSLSRVNHMRNKPDDLLKAIADKGGVIGATIFPPFLREGGSQAGLTDFVDMIDYLVNLVGIDHVGMGTDFTEGHGLDFFVKILTGNSKRGPRMDMSFLPIANPKGFESARDFPNVTGALLERGYSEMHVRKILGENFLALFRQVWH